MSKAKKQSIMTRWVVLGAPVSSGEYTDAYVSVAVKVRSLTPFAQWQYRYNRDSFRPAVAGFYADPFSAAKAAKYRNTLLDIVLL